MRPRGEAAVCCAPRCWKGKGKKRSLMHSCWWLALKKAPAARKLCINSSTQRVDVCSGNEQRQLAESSVPAVFYTLNPDDLKSVCVFTQSTDTFHISQAAIIHKEINKRAKTGLRCCIFVPLCFH